MDDFVEAFQADEEAGKWDAIVTLFFIDSARDVLEYLRTIKHCLRPGGVWVNLGPLLWHFDETSDTPAPQLSMAEVISAANALGLAISEEKEMPTHFGANANSMLQTTYNCGCFTATKVEVTSRFAVGDRVLVNLGAEKWAHGRVKLVDQPEIDSPGARLIPFVVELDPPDSKKVSIWVDSDKYITKEWCFTCS